MGARVTRAGLLIMSWSSNFLDELLPTKKRRAGSQKAQKVFLITFIQQTGRWTYDTLRS